MHGSMLLKLDPMAQVKQATRSEERNRGLETLSSCKPSPPTTLVAAAADWPASRRQLVAAPKSASRSPPLAPLSLSSGTVVAPSPPSGSSVAGSPMAGSACSITGSGVARCSFTRRCWRGPRLLFWCLHVQRRSCREAGRCGPLASHGVRVTGDPAPPGLPSLWWLFGDRGSGGLLWPWRPAWCGRWASLPPFRSLPLASLASRSRGKDGGAGESHVRLWIDDYDAVGRRLPC